MVESTPDRGKETLVSLDWSDTDLLRQMLKHRMEIGQPDTQIEFDPLWRSFFVSHVNGEESAQFLIDRCLMRPRFLLNLLKHCKANQGCSTQTS
jgi:hypothetical protein